MNVERAARRSAAGGISGGAATLAMTGAMLAAGRLGLMGEYPPERIARRGLRDTGWGPISAEALDGPVGAALHVAFGAMLGAAFAAAIAPVVAAVRRRLPARPSAAVMLPIAGVAFGSGVWLVSYWGLIPSLGILPPPDRDRPDRQVAMIAAHWVFGAALGLSLAGLANAGFEPADRMIDEEVAA
ncbi:MAG TPA: hypothetical protein VFI28_10630 [Candidatus Limnocylindrales bacterium]|nr:hypothetical protein [Candidatus Limnocylindrales bacterium]